MTEKPVWGQGAACPHKPEWHCERHGECRGCECGCDTVDGPVEEGEPDRYLGEKDLVHHPQGRRAMTAADLAAMHTRHANALPIPSGTLLGHEHLMAHADRGTLLAELNRQMEATARALSDLESVTAERDMWRQRMRVKALEKADAEAAVERLRAEREKIVPWIKAELEMYPLHSEEAEVINQIAYDLEKELASGFQEGIAGRPPT